MKYVLIGEFDELITRISAYWVKKYSLLFADGKPSNSRKFLGSDVVDIDSLTIHDFRFIVGASMNTDEFVRKLVETYKIPLSQIWSLDRFEYYLIAEQRELPVRVGIDASTICQLNCKTCYMRLSDYGDVGRGYLKFADFKRFVDRCNNIISIEISNSGEPLLNPDLVDIISYAHEKEILLTANNGVNFNTVTDELLETLVKCRFHSIKISIDGASQPVYSQYRRRGDIDRVFENIRKLIRIKKDNSSQYPILIWQYVLMDHNECEIEAAKQIASELGMRIEFKLSWDGFHPSDPERVEKLTGLYLGGSNAIKYKLPKMKICKQLFLSPQVNWDGRLLGCCYVYKSDFGVNVFDDGLEGALNLPEFRKSQKRVSGDFSQSLHKDNPCRRCSVMKKLSASKFGIVGDH